MPENSDDDYLEDDDLDDLDDADGADDEDDTDDTDEAGIRLDEHGRPPLLTSFLDVAGDTLLLDDTAEAGRYVRAGLWCRDLTELRALRLRDGVKLSALGLFLDHAETVPTLVPPPPWPKLRAARTRRRGGGWWCVWRFGRPVDAAALLHEIGRQSVWPTRAITPPLMVGDPGTLRLDHRTLNPIGFEVAVDGPVVDAADLDLRDGATAGLVASLRGDRGVRVSTWSADLALAVAGLAMAGVPVVSDVAPPAEVVERVLADDVVRAVLAPVDLDDARAREEHSVVLRRAALDACAPKDEPPISIMLATRREEMLDFALAQVARQRGVDRLELVLAPHGFDVPVSRVQDAVGPGVAVQVVPQPAGAVFGDVLHAAAAASSGELVLKMDDDDWYAPDVVADLLRARGYSGAELVGMPAELHYLTEQRLTVQRGHASEVYAPFVAGGTMLVERDVLREVGSFRSVRKYVDAQLLQAVLALGFEIYRTHGLGYVLRRNPTGHTWQVDLEYLLDPARVAATWEGFHPSRLMEVDPAHLP